MAKLICFISNALLQMFDRTSTSAVVDDMCEVYSEVQSAETRTREVLKDLFSVIKVLSNKVLEAKTTLDDIRERLSQLAVRKLTTFNRVQGSI